MTLIPSRWCEQCQEYHPDHQHIPRWSVKPLAGDVGVHRAIYAHTAGQAAERWAEIEDRERSPSRAKMLDGVTTFVVVTNMATGYARNFGIAGDLVPRYQARATSDEPFAANASVVEYPAGRES